MSAAIVERSSGASEAGVQVVEVTLSWGAAGGERTVMAVRDLAAGEPLVLGEGEGCTLLVPAEILGADRHEIVSYVGGRARVTAPPAARVWLDGIPVGGASLSAIELGAHQTVEIELGAFSLRLRSGRAERGVGASWLRSVDRGALATILGSAAVHAALFGAVAAFMPSLATTADETVDRDRVETIRRMLQASAARELEPTASRASDDGASTSGSESLEQSPASGDPGQLGRSSSEARSRSAAPGEGAPRPSRSDELREAARFGMIDLVLSMNAQERANEINLWGRPLPGGGGESSLSMFSDGIHDGPGGGVWLTGPGEGGGARGPWVGLDGISSLTGPGRCTTARCAPGGIGDSRDRPPRAHVPGPLSMRPDGDVRSNGRLPPEVIQRIVRQNDGRVRMCYQAALRENPSLQGRVEVRFLIGRSGGVSQAAGAGDLPSAGVRQCVASTFYSMSFPEPQGGVVSVVYGYTFSPA